MERRKLFNLWVSYFSGFYFSGAYIEAAHYALRYEPIRIWYQRKLAKSNLVKARKAVAHKIARGCYHVLRERTPFDIARAFG